jgi:C1A family cysteine protease
MSLLGLLGDTTIEYAKREALRLCPEIAIVGSDKNLAFLAEVDRLKKENSDILKSQDWPVKVAQSILWARPSECSLRGEYEKLGIGIKDQGRRGSCTIFGTLGVIEFHLAKRNQSICLSEQFASWAANQVSGEKGKRGSYTIKDTIEGIRKYGICTDELMPYRSNTVGRPTREALIDASTRKNVGVTWFKEYHKNDGFSDEVINSICGSIVEGAPVTVSAAWPYTARLNENLVILDKGVSSASDGHIIVIVGYSRDRRAPGGGFFTFRHDKGTGL